MCWCPFTTIFKCSKLQSHETLSTSDCIRYCPHFLQYTLHMYWRIISLKEIIQIRIRTISDATKNWLFLHSTLKRISLPRIFYIFSAKNPKLIVVYFNWQMRLGHRIGLADDYCHNKCSAIFRYFITYFKVVHKSFKCQWKLLEIMEKTLVQVL